MQDVGKSSVRCREWRNLGLTKLMLSQTRSLCGPEGTSETIWSPLPALCPRGAPAIAGLLAMVTGNAATYQTWESPEGLERPPYPGRSKENTDMCCVCFPSSTKYTFIGNPCCTRFCAWNWGAGISTGRQAPGVLGHLIWKGKQRVIKLSR